MFFVNKMSVGRRLALGYGVVISLMLMVLVAMLLQLREVEHANRVLQTEQAERLALAKEWRENIIVNVTRALALGVTANETLLKFFSDEMAYLVKRTTEIQKRYVELEETEEGKTIQARMGQERKRYLIVRQKMEDVGADEKVRQQLVLDMKDIATAYIKESTNLVQYQERRTIELGQKIDDSIVLSREVLIGATAFSAVLAFFLGGLVSRSITTPLNQIQDVTLRIAGGDLSRDVPVAQGRSELSSLLKNISAMQDCLRDLVSKSRQAALSVNQASREASAGNADLSARTEQAASSLEQTASAMDEISSTAKHSADSVRVANEQVVAASNVAQRGGQVMDDVVHTMGRIDQASRKIADIIGVIDGIAFQTNILALNAAVEAARAGEQGRGFAVVATEVRTLAQRSATAAREIKDLIGASLMQVDNGAQLVTDAGAIIRDIVDRVGQVRDTMKEISIAADEQSRGIAEVNIAITHLDQMTQQNSALVEQTTAAALQLNQQSHQLTDVINGFRLEGIPAQRLLA